MRQFVSTYNRVKDLKGDELMWGDEIEYGIFVLDHQNRKIRLSLRAKEVRRNCVLMGAQLWKSVVDIFLYVQMYILSEII